MSSSNHLANPPKVSFTVRRPTPAFNGYPQISRAPSRTDGSSDPSPHPVPTRPPLTLAGSKRRFVPVNDPDDSSGEEGTEDEIITGFDSLGVERLQPRGKIGPLVIPALKNRDWREHAGARKRSKVERFLPPGARERAEGEVVEVTDQINSGPQLAGLTIIKKEVKEETEMEIDQSGEVDQEELVKVEETLEERALRAFTSGDQGLDEPIIDAIPLQPPISDKEAFEEDVQTRPDTPTLEDYARIPVEQFGAALLRGMGWVEGTAASRTRKGLTAPYEPAARPAFLGLGARARPEDTLPPSDGKGRGGPKRPERRYVPVVKRPSERLAGEMGPPALPAPNGHSRPGYDRYDQDDAAARRALERKKRDSERDGRNGDVDRDRERDRLRERDNDRDYDRHQYSDRDDRRASDRDRDKARSERGWDSDRPRERERDDRPIAGSSRGKERDRGSDRQDEGKYSRDKVKDRDRRR